MSKPWHILVSNLNSKKHFVFLEACIAGIRGGWYTIMHQRQGWWRQSRDHECLLLCRHHHTSQWKRFNVCVDTTSNNPRLNKKDSMPSSMFDTTASVSRIVYYGHCQYHLMSQKKASAPSSTTLLCVSVECKSSAQLSMVDSSCWPSARIHCLDHVCFPLCAEDTASTTSCLNEKVSVPASMFHTAFSWMQV